MQSQNGVTVDKLLRLTDRQIWELYCNHEEDEEQEEPGKYNSGETEEDVIRFCHEAAATFNLTEEQLNDWIEKALTEWRREQAEKNGERGEQVQ